MARSACVFLVLSAALAGCSSATPTAAPSLSAVAENITFTGPVQGSLTSATTATCAVDTKNSAVSTPLTVKISGLVNGATTTVTLRIDAYIGPTTYEAQQLGTVLTGAAVTTGASDPTSQIQNSSGVISVSKSGSGTVDVTTGKQTIKGTWRCR